jgi:hypothetical protein
MKLAKDNYYVLLSGTKDFNLPGTKSVHNYYQKNRIENTKLIVVEGLGHSTPDTKEMDEALEYLNTPLKRVKRPWRRLKKPKNASVMKRLWSFIKRLRHLMLKKLLPREEQSKKK